MIMVAVPGADDKGAHRPCQEVFRESRETSLRNVLCMDA
jgi:hypothetical protein